MLKNCTLAIALVCVVISNYAQTTITLGKPYAVIDADRKYYFSKGNEILAVKVNKKTIHLQKLNSENLTFEKIRLYDDFPKNFAIELITSFQDNYYIFYSYWDGENEQLFARQIDFDAGTFNGPAQKIISVKEKITGTSRSSGFFKISTSDKFDFYFSNNNSLLAIQYRLKPEIRNDSKNYDIIGLHIFDSSLNEKWSNKIKMPYTEKKMNNLDYAVDSRGNAYIVTSVYDDDTTDEKKKGSAEPNYHLEILKIPANTTDIIPIQVNLAGNFIKTVKLYEGAQGNMTCAGFYNTGTKPGNADGIIMFKLGEDNVAYDFKTYEIPLEILNQYASSKAINKNASNESEDHAEFEHLSLRRIIANEDGSIILLGEQIYQITHSYYNAFTHTFTTYTIYYYNDMLISKIDSNGALAWMKKLPKRQQSGKGGMLWSGGSGSPLGGMSFYYFPSENKHYLVFLDNEKNIDLPVTKVPAVHIDGQGGFLTAYVVDDKTGDFNKMSILDTRNVKGMEIYQFTPRRIEKTSPTSFVFEAYKKDKEDILIKVDLK
ncbi:MAG TPA: hypothetical protein VL443_25745 [Cyclobacteriaceae bacterium]|nr:hypothetical protein [Cyclobacteriaceae bacterium]